MERTLNQDEIDALFRKARGLKTGPARRKRELARCDFRQAGQITREQARSVNGLHEVFARNLGHSLGAYLRVQLEAGLAAIEQLGFGEFMQRLPEVSYVASIGVMPIGVSAALHLDLSLAYPMIDLVLGGNGMSGALPADLTEIEEQILESIVALIARELQQVWQPVVDLGFAFERRQPMAQILRLMPPTEKVLVLGFELHLPEAHGMMSLILPAVVSTSLLRQLSEAWVYHRRQEDPDIRPRLQRLLGGARFALELALPPFPVRIGDLLALQPGQVLMFQHGVEQPAQVKVAGRRVFEAQAIRQQNRRAALIQNLQALAKPEGGN